MNIRKVKIIKMIKRILAITLVAMTIANFNVSFNKAVGFSKVAFADEISKNPIEYKIYSNDRFGFKLSYPDVFVKSTESDNGDGITLESSDGSYKLLIWGANNIFNKTGNDLLEDAKSRVAYISKEFSEKSFYRLLYSGGGDGEEITFYECSYIVGDKILSYKFSYPSAEKDKFTPIISYMTEDLLGNYYTMYDITKDSYIDGGIKINYPKINIFGDIDKQNKINDLIKNEALKALEWCKDDTSEVTFELDYEIKYKGDNILSIEYLGYENVKGAAHPANIIYTTNINMKEGSLIKLDEILNIDESLINEYKNGKYKTFTPELNLETAGVLEQIKNRFVTENLIEEFKDGTSKFYFTEKSLGISASIAHVVGDHVEFEISYENLTNHIKADNEIWSNFISK